MFGLRKRCSMEALESRQMMAGDVGAYVLNGNLYITEATGQGGLDNGVRVSRLQNGMIRVQGAEANNLDGTKSLVNGTEFQDFTIPGGLFVSLGGGNDRLHLGTDGGASSPHFSFVNINMAAPEPVVSQNAMSMAFVSPGTVFDLPDDDQVFGWGFASRGAVTINTGRGSDWVFLGTVSVASGGAVSPANVSINTGAGEDAVTIKGLRLNGNLSIQTYSHISENDGDTVYFDYSFAGLNPVTSYIGGNVNVWMGGGDDQFYVTDPGDEVVFAPGIEVMGHLTVDTGAGNDIIDIVAAAIGDATHASNLVLYTGAGADDVTIDFTSTFIEPNQTPPELKGSLYIQTYGAAAEIDRDVVRIPVGQIGGNVTLLMGGGDDEFDLHAGNWGHNITIDAGAGADTGYFAGFTHHEAMIRMGEGADNLTLGHVNADILTVDGGGGSDHLRKTAYLAVDYLFENSWEWINGRPQWMRDLYWDMSGATLAAK